MSQTMRYLSFIKELGRLKDVTRTVWTGNGRRESTAEHSWRLAVFAGILLEKFPELDGQKVLMMALLHDLGEIYEGDISAVERPDEKDKFRVESEAITKLAGILGGTAGETLCALWEEYEEGRTREARYVKALDKAETIISHNQGRNPSDFDYEFNLEYGKAYFQEEFFRELRAKIDEDTRIHVDDGKHENSAK